MRHTGRNSREGQVTTSHDVAREAGVSQATVSRAFGDSPKVSAATRERVRTVAQSLGYRPNVVAQNLVRGSSRTIALGSIGDGGALPLSRLRLSSFYYFLDVLATIERAIVGHGYDILMLSRHATSPDDFVHDLRTRQLAGVIVIPFEGAADAELRALADADIPAVLVDGQAQGRRISSVLVDNARGMRQATSYLLHLGHRRIAFFGGHSGTLAGLERQRGWEEALGEAGVPLDPGLIYRTDFTMEEAYRAALALLAERQDVTAIVASSDMMAIGILRALREYRLRVPDDISLVGFDDIDLCLFTDPPLTTVRQDGPSLGEAVVRQLLALIRREGLPLAPLVLPTQLVVRASACPPGRSSAGQGARRHDDVPAAALADTAGGEAL